MRLAIAADLHCDDFLSRVDPGTGLNARFLDMLAAVEFVGEAAVERQADALIIAGDYTERKAAVPWRVAKIAQALSAGPVRQIHVRGNHDSSRAGDDIVTILGRMPGWSGYTRPGFELVGDVAVCAIPFLSRSWLRAAPGFETVPEAEIYRILAEQYLTIARGLYAEAMAAGATAAILVGHQQLAGGQLNDQQRAFLGDLDLVVDSRALAAIGFVAVVFGHVHRAQLVLDDPACPVLYAGSTERVDWAEADEEKSFVILEIEGGKLLHVERWPTPARRFVTLTGGQMIDRLDAGEIEGAIVRVLDVGPDADAAELRRSLESSGAFDVTELRRRPLESAVATGGMSEGLSAEQALDAYFADDPDREPLVERGRAILTEVA